MFKLDSLLEKVLYSTIRIEITTPQGQAVVGTGFFFGYIKKNQVNFYLVTAKHLVKHAIKGKLSFTRSDGKKPILGKIVTITINNFKKKWFHHPSEGVDISIMPFNAIIKKLKKENMLIFFCVIDNNLIPTPEFFKEKFSVVEDLIFPGYPDNIYDTKNLIPVIRKGVTATPISVDFEGNPTFLIDASIFPGSSGSPVFLVESQKKPSKNQDEKNIDQIYLVGIISNVFIKEDPVFGGNHELDAQSLPSFQLTQFMDLGIVYKSNLIKETIEELQKGEFILFLLNRVIKNFKT